MTILADARLARDDANEALAEATKIAQAAQRGEVWAVAERVEARAKRAVEYADLAIAAVEAHRYTEAKWQLALARGTILLVRLDVGDARQVAE